MRFVNSIKIEQLLLDSGGVDGLIFTLPHRRTLFQRETTVRLPVIFHLGRLAIFPLRKTVFNT